jgi:hypothetical protein
MERTKQRKESMSILNPATIKHATISRIAIAAALLLAPLMTYSAAYLVYGQMDQVTSTHSEAIQTKTATKVSLSRADSDLIAAAIAIAHSG